MNILFTLFPPLESIVTNNKLRAKIINQNQNDEDHLQTPLTSSAEPDLITTEKLKEEYLNTLKIKDKLEDKAKSTIVSVTVSVSLIMGGSSLLTTVATHFNQPIIQWISYILFMYSVFSMVSAAIVAIKVIVDENVIYVFPVDCPESKELETYNLCVGQNNTRNIIRNNFLFAAYQCIRNTLICLFIIILIALIPLHISDSTTSLINSKRIYSFSETTLDSLNRYNRVEIKSIIESAITSINVADGQIYSIVDHSSSLCIKFQIQGADINILSIDDISWEQ